MNGRDLNVALFRSWNPLQWGAVVIGGCFVLFLVLAIAWRGNDGAGGAIGVGGSTGAETESKLHLQEFYRVQVKKGRQTWEVKAKDGKYFAKDKVTYLTEAELVVNREKGSDTTIRANAARLYVEGETLGRASLEGNVRVVVKDSITLYTELAEYSDESRMIHAPGPVRIEGRGMRIIGEGFEMNVDEETMQILKNVRSRFEEGATVPAR